VIDGGGRKGETMRSEYVLYRSLQILSRILPRSVMCALGSLLADAFYLGFPQIRTSVIANHRRIAEFRGLSLSERRLRSLARRTYRGFSRYWIDFWRVRTVISEKVFRHITVEGAEHIAEAMAMGRGVIALSAHYGSWELMPMALTALGYTMNGVVQAEDDVRTNTLFVRQRQRCGMHVIPHGKAVHGVLEALRRHEAVAIMGDVELSPHVDLVRFAGAPARLPAGPVRIALKLRAPIIQGFIRERSWNSFVFKMYPPIVPGPETSVQELQERIASVMEREIGEDPTQWYVFHNVWDLEKSLDFSRAQRVRR
jgi:KDO2-lipid IV(A) lauroyltransferase